MSLHDAYARRTPFEIAFPERTAIEALTSGIVDEVASGGADPTNLSGFITMRAVGAFVRELQDPDAPPESIHQYGALVYHAVHFLAEGCPTYLLTTPTARYLVEGAPAGDPAPPTDVGYVQFPQHLFWTAAVDDTPPESIDGLFWTVSGAGFLHVLAVVGVTPNRAGFGTIPLPEAPLTDASSWLTAEVREGGRDFASELPGGDVDGLYTLSAAGEVLKLLARCFAHVASVPTASRVGPVPDDVTGAPPSTLGYTIISLG